MNAQQTYRQAAALGASPVELVIRLYEKMIDDLRIVSAAIEKDDIARRTDRIKHAILIVGHLESALDFEKGEKVARDLELLYKSLRSRLVQLQFHPWQPAVARLITDLLFLREAWTVVARDLEQPDSNGPVSLPDDAAQGTNSIAAEATNRPSMEWTG